MTAFMNFFLRIGRYVVRRPLPSILLNVLLMLRWRCRIHPLAYIEYPLALRLGRGVRVGRCTLLCRGRAGCAIQLGDRVCLHDGVILDALGGYITIGSDTSVNPYCVLYGTGGLVIGSHCGIATHTVMVAASHTFDRPDQPMMLQPIHAQGISIGDDVWVGAGVRILDGVVLERGCIVAAGAVVTRHFREGCVVGGVPARLLKHREGFPK